MLNPFPDLLAFGLMAPFIIRIFLGWYFIIYGFGIFKKHKTNETSRSIKKHVEGVMAIIGGGLIFAGLYTQIGALMISILLLWNIFKTYAHIKSKGEEKEENNRTMLFLLLSVSLSLLFSGAGAFAFDIPL